MNLDLDSAQFYYKLLNRQVKIKPKFEIGRRRKNSKVALTAKIQVT